MAEKVLVTGGAGFIGTHTCISLLNHGYDVRVLDSLKPPVHRDGARPAHLPADVELIVGDVRDRDILVKSLSGVDAVIHLAAEQGYGPHFSEFFSVNTVGTALLYEIAVAENLNLRKVVIASSQAIYGEGDYKCSQHGVVSPSARSNAQLQSADWDLHCPVCSGPLEPVETGELSPIRPANSYGVSKYTQEMAGFTLGRQYSIPTTAYRYSIVQGPYQSFSNAYSGVCRVFVLRVMGGKRPVAYEDGKQLRDYVWVGDVAAANLLALDDQRTDFQAFNVGGARSISVNEYGKLVADVLGKPQLTPETSGLYRFGDTRHIISSSQKLNELGWHQSQDLATAIKEYAAWAGSEPEARDYFDQALEKMRRHGTVRQSQPAQV